MQPLPAPSDLFGRLRPQSPDSLLSLIKAFRDDPRATKIDLGVGVYRDDTGRTPVFAAVKEAEAHLLVEQSTKSYLGPEGDLDFLELLRPLIFGENATRETLSAVQTPGGTGALRIAAELANAARPGAHIWLGTPTWPNHFDIFAGAGLTVSTYRYFDPVTQTLTFDAMMEALNRAAPGDLVLLNGCCHNPSGADLDQFQWSEVAQRVASHGLIPLIDFAYHGLGDGLEADASGLRQVIDSADDAMLAYSCDKNFGLYRERTGALYVHSRRHTDLVRTNVLALARANWSMPPDHGAAIVRLILTSTDLRKRWQDELDQMRLRLNCVRSALARADANLIAVEKQRGLFASLPLSPDQVETLRRDWAVYAVGSGRINVAGLNLQTIETFAEALRAVMADAGTCARLS
jgi:aromatic-amino-acid transaminase